MKSKLWLVILWVYLIWSLLNNINLLQYFKESKSYRLYEYYHLDILWFINIIFVILFSILALFFLIQKSKKSIITMKYYCYTSIFISIFTFILMILNLNYTKSLDERLLEKISDWKYSDITMLALLLWTMIFSILLYSSIYKYIQSKREYFINN